MQNLGSNIIKEIDTHQTKDMQRATNLVGGDQPKASGDSKKATKSDSQKHIRTSMSYRGDGSSSSEEDSNAEPELIDSDDEAPLPSASRTRSYHSIDNSGRKCNIPPFTGKETWKVWFTRFKDIAKRQGWSDEEKLDILLPKLQGEAGSFVYDQLSSKIRSNYKLLKTELTNRFRKVENPKTYGAIFAARKQKLTESIESFAADLKKIYDKAYARRDPRTREEDLLRKFLDGLQDTKAASHVEFVKDPKNIDEAVDEIINFQEVHKKQNKARKIETEFVSRESGSIDDSGSDYEYNIARVPTQQSSQKLTKETARPTTGNNHLTETLEKMTKQLEDLKGNSNYGSPNNRGQWFTGTCYHCGQPGHFQRNCPFWSEGPTNREWSAPSRPRNKVEPKPQAAPGNV